MSPAIVQAHASALHEALQKLAAQSATLVERIARAEDAGDYAEAARLRVIVESYRTSSASYQDELDRLTGQRSLSL